MMSARRPSSSSSVGVRSVPAERLRVRRKVVIDEQVVETPIEETERRRDVEIEKLDSRSPRR